VRRFSLVAVALATIVLTGCQAVTPSVSPATPTFVTTPSATPAPEVKPTYSPAGSAELNLEYFTYLVEQVLAANPQTDTLSVARALSTSVFAVKGIQYNSERTSAGLAADSSFVAVPSAGKCLIAQFGPAIVGVKTLVAAPLQSGGCLIGAGIRSLG
jgi:hypothetical protein